MQRFTKSTTSAGGFLPFDGGTLLDRFITCAARCERLSSFTQRSGTWGSGGVTSSDYLTPWGSDCVVQDTPSTAAIENTAPPYHSVPDGQCPASHSSVQHATSG